MAMAENELKALADDELLARVKALVVRSNETEAELIAHLAEVDERRLYLPRRTSLWDFCLYDLGFSENTAWNRITVARASRRYPQVLEMLRSGRIHLTGLKMLCPELKHPRSRRRQRPLRLSWLRSGTTRRRKKTRESDPLWSRRWRRTRTSSS
jgi:hypothetical protein